MIMRWCAPEYAPSLKVSRGSQSWPKRATGARCWSLPASSARMSCCSTSPCLRAGASGYMLKDSATAELELALQAVMQGETYLSPRISKQMVEGYVQRVGGEQPKSDNLTPRQRQVLQLIAGGHSTKEIAYRLELSVKTVETHRAQLMDRLQIRDIAGLVKYAIRNGLVTAAK